jgi:hypothetical protein
MADIVVSTYPKKASFILDYRPGKIICNKAEVVKKEAGCKPWSKRVKKIGAAKSKKKKACGSNDESVQSVPSVDSGLGKRNSFCSFSTAASPKKKVKC